MPNHIVAGLSGIGCQLRVQLNALHSANQVRLGNLKLNMVLRDAAWDWLNQKD